MAKARALRYHRAMTSKYARAFADAMAASGTSNARIVSLVGGTITPANISNWKHGRRPIPAEYAPAIAALLNIPPERISAAYERLVRAQADASQGAPAIAGHVVVERLQDFGGTVDLQRIVLPEFLLRTRIGITPLSAVRWTFQPSTAMAPAIHRHALVFVDASSTRRDQVVEGGTYAYKLWGRPDIRRILIRKDGWALARYGNDIGHTFVPEDDLSSLEIMGSVLGWIDAPKNDTDL